MGNYLFLWVGLGAGILILFNAGWSIWVGRKSIFPGSGVPNEMAQVLLSSIHLIGQQLVAIFVIVIIAILICYGCIDSQAGLPIISAVAGYCLAKSFKDVAIIPSSKKPGPIPSSPEKDVVTQPFSEESREITRQIQITGDADKNNK
jgi:hypothetical protein